MGSEQTRAEWISLLYKHNVRSNEAFLAMLCRVVAQYAAHIDHSSLFAKYLNNFAETELNAYYLLGIRPDPTLSS